MYIYNCSIYFYHESRPYSEKTQCMRRLRGGYRKTPECLLHTCFGENKIIHCPHNRSIKLLFFLRKKVRHIELSIFSLCRCPDPTTPSVWYFFIYGCMIESLFFLGMLQSWNFIEAWPNTSPGGTPFVWALHRLRQSSRNFVRYLLVNWRDFRVFDRNGCWNTKY